MEKKVILFDSLVEAKSIMKDRESRNVKLEGFNYGLVRYGDNIYLFEALCPHKEYPLVQGKVSVLGEIVCGWHSYRFSLTGGKEKEGRCRSIFIKKLTEDEDGKLVVMLESKDQ